jgi:tetratricopeptide (TPR) repeat protein
VDYTPIVEPLLVISLNTVIEASYKALGKEASLHRGKLTGDQLRRALEALSVLRPDPSWFTAKLAVQVMDAPEQALAELAGAGLIEKVRYPGEDEWNSGDPRYTMHRVIAEYIRTKLAPERSQALVRQAANYYLEQLSQMEKAYQEGDATTYSEMYRYENPDWQDCKDDWLYYFAQTRNDYEEYEASLSFLHVWFDGFWWWSCFTDKGFDFCDQLLLEWEHRLTLSATGFAAPAFSDSSERLERRTQGLDLLRRFKDIYPKESADRASGSWPEVASTLRDLRQLSSLDGDSKQLTQPARHVRALTDIFLAEAERFGDGDLAAAEAYYREAQALFRLDHDDWNVAWSLYHLANMLAERGRHGEIRLLCEEALALGRAGGDHEVVALSHRVLGDGALAGHDAEAALRNYRLALEHAYRFQVEPRDPDDYTVQFYADMTHALAEPLLLDHAREPELTLAIGLGLRYAWKRVGVELPTLASDDALFEDASVATLAERMFPPTLEPRRLGEAGTTYAEKVRADLKAIEGSDAAGR